MHKWEDGWWYWPWPVRSVQATGQTGVGQACHSSSNQVKDDLLSKNKVQKQAWQEIARNGVTNKNKSRIWHECRQKGHMGKDCPNGNVPKSNLVHYDFHKLRNYMNGTCVMREISSPQSSMRAIWVPKHLVANPIGPNKCWVSRNACWSYRLNEMH
jgi:hypothetical protein